MKLMRQIIILAIFILSDLHLSYAASGGLAVTLKLEQPQIEGEPLTNYLVGKANIQEAEVKALGGYVSKAAHITIAYVPQELTPEQQEEVKAIVGKVVEVGNVTYAADSVDRKFGHVVAIIPDAATEAKFKGLNKSVYDALKEKGYALNSNTTPAELGGDFQPHLTLFADAGVGQGKEAVFQLPEKNLKLMQDAFTQVKADGKNVFTVNQIGSSYRWK